MNQREASEILAAMAASVAHADQALAAVLSEALATLAAERDRATERAALAEEEAAQARAALANATPLHDDAPAWDGTPGAHPAYWRGHEAGALARCIEVREIINGNRPTGHAADPWHTIRKRLWRLVKQAGPACAEGSGDSE